MLKTQAWKASYYVNDDNLGVSSPEYHVSNLLGISLRVSKCMGLSPVRLRRYRDNLFVELSPDLVVFQRLLMILSSITIFIGLGYDFKSHNHVRVGSAIFTAALWITEICLIVSICILSAFRAPGAIDRLIQLLKQMNKINKGLSHGTSTVRRSKFGNLLLVSYIILTALIHITDYAWFQFNTANHLVMTFYLCFYYQTFASKLIQLQVALILSEITSLVVALNVHLERLLKSISQKSNDAVNSTYGYLTIRQLAQYYEQTTDMVREMDEGNGTFLFLVFVLVFLELLITPYNLLSGIVLHKNAGFIVQETCWTIYHFVSLLVIVEPCQWIQDQMNRTRYLLSRLARRSTENDERFLKELDLFIMQVQINGMDITPMGVFTISRALVASIIGSVTTYLAIIVQMHKVTEIL